MLMSVTVMLMMLMMKIIISCQDTNTAFKQVSGDDIEDIKNHDQERNMMIMLSMFSSSTRALEWAALSCAL